jgi:uncharacterized protein (TIGR01319 family)
MEGLRLLIDVGSTFTKAVAVDMEKDSVLCTAKSPTTVKDDITIGLMKTLRIIEGQIGSVDGAEIVACSSAAGGLRMVSIGLVPELSSEAARRAALGAGAKIVGHYCHQLTKREIREIEGIAPDIILLAGGTDGGNDSAIIHNATMLSGSSVASPIIVAGNKCAYDKIEEVFGASSKEPTFVGNVMPQIGTLEVDACREAIREVFMGNIVHAKGLDKARALVQDIIMPTPAAVLRAANLLANGTDGEEGMGELIVVDVGGATTDVYSIAKGNPTSGAALMKGLPEPYAKRTVEGDLGVRHNIEVLVAICRNKGIDVDEAIAAAFHSDPERLPMNEKEAAFDDELARIAVETSFERHVGKVEIVYGPHGELIIQTGKDLTGIRTVIGTGGPVINSTQPGQVLGGILAHTKNSSLLKPKTAEFYLDDDYIMYAAGLLAQSAPKTALRILKKYIRPL